MNNDTTLSAIIVEDEPNMRALVRQKISESPFDVNIIGEAGDVPVAEKMIREMDPDLVFLDIQIKQFTGFDLLERLPDLRSGVIFITAYDSFALKAIKVSAIDYILKPIRKSELEGAIGKAFDQFRNKEPDTRTDVLMKYLKNPKSQVNRIGIPTPDGYEFLKIENIVRCESDRNYTQVIKHDGKVLVSSYTLKEFDNLLTEMGFFRIHKSHLINLNHIVRFSKKDGNVVVTTDNATVPVSRNKKDEFLNVIKVL